MPISRKVALSAFVLYLILSVFPDASCMQQQYKFGGTPSRRLKNTVPKSICFSKFKASKPRPSRKTRLPQAPYIPPKTNFGGYLAFLWMLFISAHLFFHRLLYTATGKYKINLLANPILFLAQNRKYHQCCNRNTHKSS